MIRLEEAAKALGISKRTLERLVAAGRIRVIRPSPGRVAIEERELDAYIKSLRRAA